MGIGIYTTLFSVCVHIHYCDGGQSANVFID